MSFTDPSLDAQPEPAAPAQPDPAVIEAQAAAAAAQRELAIVRALPNVDTTTPLGQMFVTSYSGEPTPEAVQAAAQAVGLLAPPAAPETTPAPTPEQSELTQIRDQVQQGGVLAPPTAEELEQAIHPVDAGFAAMKDAMGRGIRREDAAAQFIHRQIAAAATGDERAIFKGWTEDQLAGNAGR